MVTRTNKPLYRQSSQNTQLLNDTLGSHADRNTSTSMSKPLDPVNQIAQATETIAKNSQSLFHPKNTLIFNGKNEKNEKFEYFENLFHTTLKMQPNLTEAKKIKLFHAHLRGLTLKIFKNIQRTSATTLENILKVFRRKYVNQKPVLRHRFHRLKYDPENQKLLDFLEDLQESAKKAFGDNVHHMIENLLYAKMPPHLKKSINQAYLANGSFDQNVKHLQREMELNGLESDEPLVKTQMTALKKNAKIAKNPSNNRQKRVKHRLQKQYPAKPSQTTSVAIARMQATLQKTVLI